jgi:hypothetical protein
MGRARATSARMKCYEKYCPDLTQKEKEWLGFEDPAKLREILNRVSVFEGKTAGGKRSLEPFSGSPGKHY